MKNQTDKKTSTVDDFIANKRQEYLIEEARSKKMSKVVLAASALIALFAKEDGYQLIKNI